MLLFLMSQIWKIFEEKLNYINGLTGTNRSLQPSNWPKTDLGQSFLVLASTTAYFPTTDRYENK